MSTLQPWTCHGGEGAGADQEHRGREKDHLPDGHPQHASALELGNRTLMMDGGRIVFDVKGEERSKMTVDDLLEKFRENAGKALDNDRILLSKVEAGN